jgi:hypothetical protein
MLPMDQSVIIIEVTLEILKHDECAPCLLCSICHASRCLITDQLFSSFRMNSEQSMFVKIELFGLEMRIAQVRFKDVDPAPLPPLLTTHYQRQQLKPQIPVYKLIQLICTTPYKKSVCPY